MKGRRQEEDGTNLNQADARTIRKWARQRNAKPATGRNSGTSTLIGEDESVESEDIEQKCIFEGIFEAQHLVLRNVETGDVSRVIPAPRNKCYDCLYCLRAGIIYGTRKLKGAKRHRAQCENNPNRKLHSAQYIYEYEQRPKKLKTSAENIIDPPAREKKREEGTDNTKYWVKLALKSWACRKCRKRGEPLKTWSSQGWVRNHWLKCKYNKRKGLTVPRPLPPSKRKLLNKNVRKLRGKRTLKSPAMNTTQDETRPGYGIGSSILAKMGYEQGKGLGSEGQGMINPVEVKQRPHRMGLGSDKKLRKRMIMFQPTSSRSTGRIGDCSD